MKTTIGIITAVLTVLAIGCTRPPALSPLHASVSHFAQHHYLGPDSARYVSLRFGPPQPFWRSDSLQPELEQCAHLYDQLEEVRMVVGKALDRAHHARVRGEELAHLVQANDTAVAHCKLIKKHCVALVKQATPTVIGQTLVHSWRVGQRVDSARFVVFTNGVVRQWGTSEVQPWVAQ